MGLLLSSLFFESTPSHKRAIAACGDVQLRQAIIGTRKWELASPCDQCWYYSAYCTNVFQMFLPLKLSRERQDSTRSALVFTMTLLVG